MKARIRLILCVAVAGILAWSAQERLIPRYRCNRILAWSRVANAHLARFGDRPQRLGAAIRVMEALAPCERPFGESGAMRIEIANTYVLMGQHELARASLRQALRFERRAEIHYFLGILEAGAGNRAAAHENLARAVRMNPDYLDRLGEPLRAEVSLSLGR